MAWACAIATVCGGDGRLEISSTAFPLTLTNSGSYILTEDLTGVAGSNGITIQASDIVLDLNGMTLAGTAGSLNGIVVPQVRTNLVVRNGVVRDWGLAGIDAARASNGRYEDLALSGNAGTGLVAGTASSIVACKAVANGGAGIDAGAGSTVRACTLRANGGDGLLLRGDATVAECVARDNGGNGMAGGENCAFALCSSRDNGGAGILAGSGCLVRDCTLHGNARGVLLSGEGAMAAGCVAMYSDTHGFEAAARCTVRDCVAMFSGGDGIRATNAASVTGNNCGSNAVGIRVTGRYGRIQDNHVVGNRTGVVVSVAGNLIARNTATTNIVADYSIQTGNHFQVYTNPASSFPTNPWVNFKF